MVTTRAAAQRGAGAAPGDSSGSSRAGAEGANGSKSDSKGKRAGKSTRKSKSTGKNKSTASSKCVAEGSANPQATGAGAGKGKGKSTSKSRASRPVLSQPFPYTLPLSQLDLSAHPYLYRPGRGEQGVFHALPYKQQLLPLWRFRDEEAAEESAREIVRRYEAYKEREDFVGCDMARKYLQMGYTRARRYANHAGGTKRKRGVSSSSPSAPHTPAAAASAPTADQLSKARAAAIFGRALARVRADAGYARLRAAWAARFDADEAWARFASEESLAEAAEWEKGRWSAEGDRARREER